MMKGFLGLLGLTLVTLWKPCYIVCNNGGDNVGKVKICSKCNFKSFFYVSISQRGNIFGQVFKVKY